MNCNICGKEGKLMIDEILCDKCLKEKADRIGKSMADGCFDYFDTLN